VSPILYFCPLKDLYKLDLNWYYEVFMTGVGKAHAVYTALSTIKLENYAKMACETAYYLNYH